MRPRGTLLPILCFVLLQAGCVYMPRLRSARSLMPGQQSGSYTIQGSTYKAAPVTTTASLISATDDAWQGATSAEERWGLPLRGLEMGATLDSSLTLAADLKYQLWIPMNPSVPVLALDAEANLSYIGPGASAALLFTQPFSSWEIDAGLRGMRQYYGNGPFAANFANAYGSYDYSSPTLYGYTPGAAYADMADISAGLQFNFMTSAVQIWVDYRSLVAQGQPLSAQALANSVGYQPAWTFGVTWLADSFVPYSGSHYAPPASHAFSYTPYEEQSAEEHMAMGKKLYKYKMYLDARDEFNAALLNDPEATQAYEWIGISLFFLKEYDLALYNFEMAKSCYPEQKGLDRWIQACQGKHGF